MIGLTGEGTAGSGRDSSGRDGGELNWVRCWAQALLEKRPMARPQKIVKANEYREDDSKVARHK
jgi:hypothetical protein